MAFTSAGPFQAGKYYLFWHQKCAQVYSLTAITADTSVARLDNIFNLQIKKMDENLWSWRVSLVWMVLAIFCRATLGGKGSVELHRDLAKQEQSKAEMCNAWRSAHFCPWCHCRAAGELQNCAPVILLISLQAQGAPGALLWLGGNSWIHRDLLSSPTKCNIFTKTLQPWCSVQKASLAH